MQDRYRDFLIRSWSPMDRVLCADLISCVLSEYGLAWEADGADRDVLQIEEYYLQTGGEFWVVELPNRLVGTAAYYPVDRGEKAVEIRKMYLLPDVRGLGLGKYLLQKLELAIANRGFAQIWVETASVLTTAVKLYESNGYHQSVGIETKRCDRIYAKLLNSTIPNGDSAKLTPSGLPPQLSDL